jgi:hypothetical protein
MGDPASTSRMMKKELGLEDEQAARVEKLLQTFQAQQDEMRKASRPTAEQTQELAELRKKMREARQTGDEEAMQAARERMSKMRQERMAAMQPARDKLDAAVDQLHDDLLAVMRDDQQEAFEQLWTERLSMQFGKSRRHQRSATALKAMVDRLNDLTPEQELELRGLFETFRKTAHKMKSQDAPGNWRTEEKKLTTKLYDDVLAVLSEEQRTRLEKMLGAGRPPHLDGPRGRGHGHGHKGKHSPEGGRDEAQTEEEQ